MKKKKEEIEISPYLEKIHKEVKQSYYDYDKILIGYISALNKCDTHKEVLYFRTTALAGFKDAPDELLLYLNNSINNKIQSLAKKELIDLGMLKSIANSPR